MSEALRHRKARVHVGWRLGGAVVLATVAAAVGFGGQPAFAASKPAPGADARATAAHPARHHAAAPADKSTPARSRHAAKPKAAATPNKAGTAGKAATKAAPAAKAATTATPSAKAAGASANAVRPELVTPITVTPGTNTADVDWADDSAAGALSYTVTVDNGGDDTACADIEVPDHTCTLSGLDAGTTYTATVTSYDAAGGLAGAGNPVSGPSASNPFTVGAPGAPTGVNITNLTTDGFDANWTAPTNPGAGIDGFTATAYPGGDSCTGAAIDTTCSITVTNGLQPGVVYTVAVVANSAAGGDSAPGWSMPPVVTGAPGAPTDVMAMAGDGQATVSWTAPTDFAPQSYYTVTATGPSASAGSPSTPPSCSTLDATRTSCTVTGLTNLTAYTFTVVAHGTNGDSHASDASASVVPIGGAVNLTANANSKFVTAEAGGNSPLIANRTAASTWEEFDVTANADGTVSFKAAANGKYVTAEGAGNGPLIANRTAIGSWEKFWVIDEGGGMFALKAMANGKYVTAEGGGNGPLIANRSVVAGWEEFSITAVAATP